MTKFETVEVPFKMLGNLQLLTVKQITEEPWLMDFIKRFPDCFEYRHDLNVYVYYPSGDAHDHA